MKNSRKFANVIAATVLFAAALFITVRAHSDVQASDTAAFYKAKCVACHGKSAEKKFDSSLPEEQLIDIVLKGKKAAKPPHMPGYGDKGVSSEQAKALIDHMKQLKAGQ
ncbi:MAG: cytochrome c [Pyrinomonadaceae bacterium]|nr:cytochrome c [Pyrinomonadaceae bacterium]